MRTDRPSRWLFPQSRYTGLTDAEAAVTLGTTLRHHHTREDFARGFERMGPGVLPRGDHPAHPSTPPCPSFEHFFAPSGVTAVAASVPVKLQEGQRLCAFPVHSWYCSALPGLWSPTSCTREPLGPRARRPHPRQLSSGHRGSGEDAVWVTVVPWTTEFENCCVPSTSLHGGLKSVSQERQSRGPICLHSPGILQAHERPELASEFWGATLFQFC